jgi:hypothetical protein
LAGRDASYCSSAPEILSSLATRSVG